MITSCIKYSFVGIVVILGFVCIYLASTAVANNTKWAHHVNNVNRYNKFRSNYQLALIDALMSPNGERWVNLTTMLDFAKIPYLTNYHDSIPDRIRSLPTLPMCDYKTSTFLTGPFIETFETNCTYTELYKRHCIVVASYTIAAILLYVLITIKLLYDFEIITMYFV